MSQDNVRSTVYRSLKKTFYVPHEGSNEPGMDLMDGTNRKSKTPSPMMKAVTMQMTDEDPLPTFISKEEMNNKDSTGTSKLHSLSSSQLWQVSQGAEMLNQMVDSWSKGLAFSGHSRDIADDLLKGASDLQESLVMLGKLQEKLMAQMKNQKPNMGKEAAERIDPKNKGSYGFQKSINQNHLQVPQVSADGSSRKRIEELKKVIRESLYKQNLLPVPSFEEKESLGGGNINSISDGLLESSSRAPPVPFRDGCKETCYDQKPRVDSYNSVTSLHRAKKPNLIAKILGLEDFPSEAVQTTKKQTGSKKCSYAQCSNFDIGMPKNMKLFTDQSRDPGERTLKEIIDTMHFKGLLKRSYSGDNEIQSHLLETSESKGQSRNSCEERMDDKMPTIVILKPLHFSYPEREEIKPVKLIQIEGVSDTKQIVERTGAKEQKVMRAIVQECGGSDYKQLGENSGGKVEEQKIKEAVAVEDCVSDSKQVLKKSEMEECKIVKTAHKSCNKNKASFYLPSKQMKMQASKTCRKVNGVQKVLTDRSKSVKENTKSAIASRSQVETAMTKLKKPDRTVSVKNHTCQTSALQNQIFSHSKHPASQKSMNQVMRNQKKKYKQGRVSPAVNSITENFHIEDEKGTVPIPTLEMNCISSAARTSFDDLHSTQTEQEEMETKDETQEDFCTTPIVVPDPIQCRGRTDHANEANQLDEDKATVSNTIKYRRLLLSSPSFLSCAEDLFDLDIKQPSVVQTIGVDGTGNARLVLDCTHELMTCKSRQREYINHQPLQTHIWGPKVCLSMDQLVEELVNGIEKLRCCSKIGDGVLPRDGIYLMLQRDLFCKGMLVNGAWDLGWVNGFSMDDAEQVVSEVQNHVVSGLVDEVIMDLLY